MAEPSRAPKVLFLLALLCVAVSPIVAGLLSIWGGDQRWEDTALLMIVPAVFAAASMMAVSDG